MQFTRHPNSERLAMKKTAPPRLKRFPSAKQRLLDQLLERNSEGTITESQRAALERLVGEAEQLMVANGKRLAEFARSGAAGPPANAVPVTVWVTPESAER
jgi:hypothetical protein